MNLLFLEKKHPPANILIPIAQDFSTFLEKLSDKKTLLPQHALHPPPSYIFKRVG